MIISLRTINLVGQRLACGVALWTDVWIATNKILDMVGTF
jgi:hypothetical protein